MEIRIDDAESAETTTMLQQINCDERWSLGPVSLRAFPNLVLAARSAPGARTVGSARL
jgi:hypothetical protein